MSMPSGGGTETLIRTAAPATTTAEMSSRSGREARNVSGTGQKNTRHLADDWYAAGNRKRAL
jgi:hypothetical protein